MEIKSDSSFKNEIDRIKKLSIKKLIEKREDVFGNSEEGLIFKVIFYKEVNGQNPYASIQVNNNEHAFNLISKVDKDSKDLKEKIYSLYWQKNNGNLDKECIMIIQFLPYDHYLR